MSKNYAELLELGYEAKNMSIEIFRICREVNELYDRVFVIHETLRSFQEQGFNQASLACPGYQLSNTLFVNLTKVIVSLIKLESGMKTRLAVYGSELDLLRLRIENSRVSSQDAGFEKSYIELKLKLLSSLDLVCETVVTYINSPRLMQTDQF